jgi:acid phosphatase type 7
MLQIRKFSFIIFLFLLFLFPFFTSGQNQHIIAFGSSWKYLDNGSDPGPDWITGSFNENNWKEGTGKFGYGINDAATSIQYGNSKKKEFITSYFRKTLHISDSFASFNANLMIDDGAVIYVNGVEVYRYNMPSDNINYTTTAISDVKDDGSISHPFSIDANLIQVGGLNTIAVEVHQQRANSPDMAFDLELIGNTISSPPTATQYTLAINASSGGSVSKSPDQASYASGTSVTLTATPASGYQFTGWGGDASGTQNPLTLAMNANKSISANFSPVPTQQGQRVTGFTLVDAHTEQDLWALTDGATISLAELENLKLNVRAGTSPATVGSVRFELSGTQSKTYTDSQPPYALHGDDGSGNYYYGNWNPPPVGSYTLKATPYSEAKARGTAGMPLTIAFTVVEQSGAPNDQTPPYVVSINRQDPTATTTSADYLTFRVTFSEKVIGVDPTDFLVIGSPSSIVNNIAHLIESDLAYDVTVAVTSGEGTLRLELKESGTNIQDLANNSISGGHTNGQEYLIQTDLLRPLTNYTFFPYMSSWKYLDDGSNQTTLWQNLTYDDGYWETGYGEFGYGEGDEKTIIKFGPDTDNKFITTYFRKVFTIVDASSFDYYTANLKIGDGAIIYVNGIEVYRKNMPERGVLYNTLASSNGNSVDSFNINSDIFSTGANVVAVEIHQSSINGSDISFDMQLNGKVGVQPILLKRGPYLQAGSKTGITIRWRTDVETDSKIEVGTAYGNYIKAALNSELTTEHEVRIDNLIPNTKYYYRIGDSNQVLQEGYNNYFITAPPDTIKRKIRIAVFGDSGRDSDNNRTGSLNSYYNYTGNNPAEILLLLGDNAYVNGTDDDYQREFFDPFNNMLKNHVLFPTPGNHDYGAILKTSRNEAGYYGSFTMPTAGESGGVPSGSKAFYSFDWGDIHFISLDSYGEELIDNTKLYDTLGIQVKWLKNDLENNTKNWIVVYFHHPPYSMGSHNSDTESHLIKIRENLVPILERYRVDLVLNGHSHNYERSYLLNNYYGNEASFNLNIHTKSNSSAFYNGSNNSCAYVTTSSDNQDQGITYVVAGSGGASGSVQPGYPHNALPFAINDGGMLYLEIEDNRLDGKMLRKNGTIFDNFTIMKDVNQVRHKSIASGSAAVLKASWIGTYSWSTGETTRSITVNPLNTTTYYVSDIYNCITDTFNVSVNTSVSSTQNDIFSSLRETNIEINSPEIYPTIVKQGLQVKVNTNTIDVSKILVLDITGRVVYTTTFTNNTSLETARLPTGMYIINLLWNNQLIKRKIVITE